MDQKTEIFTNAVGEFLRNLMKERGLTANAIVEQHPINKQQLYAVLRMGSPARPNYTIETFVKVLGILDVHIEFHDKHERSNFDLLPPGQQPSEN